LKAPARRLSAPRGPARRVSLKQRLAEAEETIRAIRCGEVDAVLVASRQGDRVYTLAGADQAYRLLIESMNEGALTLTVEATILYANQCFARMLRLPLEQIIGSSFQRFLSAADRAAFQQVLEGAGRAGSKISVLLQVSGHPPVPVQVSLQGLVQSGGGESLLGLVVTDLTELRRSEEMLRSLTHRVVQAQEVELSRVAGDLHDHIVQPLCAAVMQSQSLVAALSPGPAPARKEARKLRQMVGRTADAVERIARELRPGVLLELGLAVVLSEACAFFAKRTGTAVKVTGGQPNAPLSAEVELALYRILQEALKNVGQHARARQVMVGLSEKNGSVQLAIKDDGIGFDPNRLSATRPEQGGLGLLGMRERAAYVNGSFLVKSSPGAGTEILVRIPI
jgi:PAS domain S-box-containing protein